LVDIQDREREARLVLELRLQRRVHPIDDEGRVNVEVALFHEAGELLADTELGGAIVVDVEVHRLDATVNGRAINQQGRAERGCRRGRVAERGRISRAGDLASGVLRTDQSELDADLAGCRNGERGRIRFDAFEYLKRGDVAAVLFKRVELA